METKQTKTIYDLELHETICINEGKEIYVTRVPNGWIYEFQKPHVNILEIVFVPYNSEFYNMPKSDF